MSAYVIIGIEVTNAQQYERYKELAGPTMATYGAKLLAKTADIEVLEGAYESPMLVMLEFESLGKAKEWWGSDEYKKAIAARKGAANFVAIAAAGT